MRQSELTEKTQIGWKVGFMIEESSDITSLQLNSNVCFKPKALKHHRL